VAATAIWFYIQVKTRAARLESWTEPDCLTITNDSAVEEAVLRLLLPLAMLAY
jgi:hypothetical protein